MAITFVSSARDAYFSATPASTLTTTIDIGTRTNGMLVAFVFVRSSSVDVSSVTWNGVSMTAGPNAVNASGTPGNRVAIYYLPGPADGSNDLVVTLDASTTAFAVHVAWFDGAAQTTPSAGSNTATGNSTAPSVSVTPSEDNCLVVGGAISDDPATALTTGSGETAIFNIDEGPYQSGSSYVIQTTAAAQTVDWTAGSDFWAAAALALKEAAGGQTVAVGQVVETDAAQEVAWAPMHRLVSQTVESDLAQAVGTLKSLVVGQASETDLAQAAGRLKALGLAQATETDLAQAISVVGDIVVILNQAVETDAAQEVAWSPKNRLVKQAVESDLAQAVGTLKSLVVGQAGETDLAQAAGRLKALGLAQATETDLAQSIAVAGALIVAVGMATETEAAQAIGRLKIAGLGQVSESGLAQAIGRLKALGMGQAAEADAAQDVSWSPKNRLVNQAAETDLALTLILVAGVLQVYEANVMANIAPDVSVKANVTPAADVEADPAPDTEVFSG